MAAEGGPFVFRINENGTGPNLLVQVCVERGWREFSDNGGPQRDQWNLWWRASGFPASLYRSLKSWQFANHIPKSSSITRKDTLARYLRCMRNIYGTIYDFSPPVYNLPLEYNKLVAECSRTRIEGCASEDMDVWICKPVGLSQGRGIYLFRKLSDLTYDSSSVVQRYIANPLLIGGYKFDLRLYVCVPSYHPLAVYMYREGLVRFSTDKFSMADLDNPFRHLTNCSLNKLGPGYNEKKDRVGAGCKWTLRQLRMYLAQAGIDDWVLWQRVAAIVVLTVLSQVSSIPCTANCFEFFGFDILIDASLRPWLLEVNLCPALVNDCDVDPAVKKPMLHDLFDLLGLPVCNTGLSLFTMWSPSPSPSPPSSPRSPPSPPPTPAPRRAPVAAAADRWRRRQKQRRSCNDAASDESSVSPPPPLPSSLRERRSVMAGAGERGRVRGKSAGSRRAGSMPGRRLFSAAQNDPPLRVTQLPLPPSAPPDAPASRYRRPSATVPRPAPPRTSIARLAAASATPLVPTINVTIPHGFSQKSPLIDPDQTWSHYTPHLMCDGPGPGARRGRGRAPPPTLWGNGRNWQRATPEEGDWVRLYPLWTAKEPLDAAPTAAGACGEAAPNASLGDKEVRRMVAEVGRLVKGAREVGRRMNSATDAERTRALKTQIGLSGEVWMPRK